MIQSIEQVQQLVRDGCTDWKQYGRVGVKSKDNLLLFSYTKEVAYEGNWTFFERICRGLILNTDGEIIARPFDKFFNWEQDGYISSGNIVAVSEKLDGSLGILYRQDGYKLATPGSFDSEQAIWGTEFLKRYDLSDLPEDLTLLFEIIYPENRNVVNYEERKELVLLAIRNRFTGNYISIEEIDNIWAKKYGFNTPKRFAASVQEIIDNIKTLDADHEGYVVDFDDGQKFKFKGDRYCELHRLLSGVTFKNALIAVRDNTVNKYRTNIPDEFLTQFNEWVFIILNKIYEVKEEMNMLYSMAPKENKKEFALWVLTNYKDYAPYLFVMYENKPIDEVIFKTVYGITPQVKGYL